LFLEGFRKGTNIAARRFVIINGVLNKHLLNKQAFIFYLNQLSEMWSSAFLSTVQALYLTSSD